VADPADVPFKSSNPEAALYFWGAILGFAAVGLHQNFKALFNRFGISTGDTEVFARSKDMQAVKTATAELKEATSDLLDHAEPVDSKDTNKKS
jgi:catechol 2,3-dioxygenase-like lactoylglutathione lyase family enzyme